MKRALILMVAGLPSAAAQEPPPRPLTAVPVPLAISLATISGVRELRDGRLVVTDGKRAGVYLADMTTHTMTPIGSPGGEALQYAQPGGFYGAAGDSAWLLDRGLAKILMVSPSGAIVREQSIKQKGITSSNSDDNDHQRIDARGLAYFTIYRRKRPAKVGDVVIDSTLVVRFDAARQSYDTVAFLREPEARVTQASENMEITQAVIGSPSDAWGVEPDGRVAVVRATPYHVEWYGPNSTVSRGPVYAAPAIAYTPAEKDSIGARQQGHGASVGLGGASASAADMPHLFAETKPPFAREDVIVSPQRHVWVARTHPFGAAGTTYDVFDAKGDRVDRVLLPGGHIVGFGRNAVYVMVRAENNEPSLLKYKL